MSLPIELDRTRSALLLIDLQVGITNGFETVPHDASTVVGNAASMVDAFHSADIPVIFVRVNYGLNNELQVRVPHAWESSFDPPAGWDELDPRLGGRDGDVVVVKHVTSAFYGTNLDVQLRQRGISTLVLGGIATHQGVEATARSAYDRGYTQLFVEDAMGAVTPEQHHHAVEQIFPLMGYIVSTDTVVSALKGG